QDFGLFVLYNTACMGCLRNIGITAKNLGYLRQFCAKTAILHRVLAAPQRVWLQQQITETKEQNNNN
ncbi:hypothetical protein, partial [Prevotellamassilia timonensis]|uniref:hypothetical protein n=1 Tax=Prevotellamassilia timonensis TaxID=1852370 RepID=UPI00307CB28D